MTETKTQKETEARLRQMLSCLNDRDYSGAARVFTNDGTFMPHDSEPIKGRKALEKRFESVMETLNKIVVEDVFHFELVNDTTAYMNVNQTGYDSAGKTVVSLRSGMLWRKLNDEWFISRSISNYGPKETSPEDIARKRIQERISELYAALNKEDYDAAINIYADGATVIPHEASVVTGKAAIKEIFKEAIPPMLALAVDKLYYFELLNDTTAYTNSHMKSLTKEGKVQAAFRDALVWTKVNGDWYIKRDMFNDLPLPKE